MKTCPVCECAWLDSDDQERCLGKHGGLEIFTRAQDGAVFVNVADLLVWLRTDAVGVIFAYALEGNITQGTRHDPR